MALAGRIRPHWSGLQLPPHERREQCGSAADVRRSCNLETTILAARTLIEAHVFTDYTENLLPFPLLTTLS